MSYRLERHARDAVIEMGLDCICDEQPGFSIAKAVFKIGGKPTSVNVLLCERCSSVITESRTPEAGANRRLEETLETALALVAGLQVGQDELESRLARAEASQARRGASRSGRHQRLSAVKKPLQ